MSKEMFPIITPKGIAFLSAIKAGFIEETDNEYDETKFNVFWELFERDLLKHYHNEMKQFSRIFNNLGEKRELEAERKRLRKKTYVLSIGSIVISILTIVVIFLPKI